MKVIEQAGSTINYLIFNHRQPYTNNVLVRQAIAYALDYEKIMASQDAVRACSFFYCKSEVDEGYFGKTFHYDVAKAKALMAQAGYPTGIPDKIRMFYTTTLAGPETTDVVAIMQSNLKAIGINLDVQQIEVATLIDYLQKRTVQLAPFTFAPQNPDAHQVAGSAYLETGNLAGFVGFSDAEASSIVKAAAIEPDPAKRIALYRSLQRKFDPEVHLLPMFTPKDYIFYRANVKGVRLTPTPLWYVFDFTELDK